MRYRIEFSDEAIVQLRGTSASGSINCRMISPAM
jgi:hypothetical protein